MCMFWVAHGEVIQVWSWKVRNGARPSRWQHHKTGPPRGWANPCQPYRRNVKWIVHKNVELPCLKMGFADTVVTVFRATQNPPRTRYTTIMSYTQDCTAARVNYFANPDVSYLDQPTGSETENCARAIQENRVGQPSKKTR